MPEYLFFVKALIENKDYRIRRFRFKKVKVNLEFKDFTKCISRYPI